MKDKMKRAILLIFILALLLQPALAWSYRYSKEEFLLMFLILLPIGIGVGVILARMLLSITESEIEHVKSKHEDELLRIEGVVAIKADRKRRCIKVYVKKEAEIEKIPRNLDGYPVEIERVGRIRLIFWWIIRWWMWWAWWTRPRY